MKIKFGPKSLKTSLYLLALGTILFGFYLGIYLSITPTGTLVTGIYDLFRPSLQVLTFF